MIDQIEKNFGKILAEDFETILQESYTDLDCLVNSNIVITGASGFIGKWLTFSWLYARQKLDGKGKILLTSRDLTSLSKLCESFEDGREIAYLESDIRAITIPKTFKPLFLIHAATPASAQLNNDDPAEMLSNIIDGQRQILQQATQVGIENVLFLSSGAIYGTQPTDMRLVNEAYMGGPSLTSPASAYHEGKRVAELLGNIFADRGGLRFTTGRLFAFLAPYLPFNTHFAAGNFMLDALENRNIAIKSDGQSVRSYQYGTDLCVFLWALLNRGQSGEAYNVGSDEPILISDLALKIKEIVSPHIEVSFKKNDVEQISSRYVPDISKMSQNLNVKNKYGTADAVSRTASWWQDSNTKPR
jgi:nucleoside-diphosphate-sugar epimerase